MTRALAKYDAMCRAIDQAYRVDEVKDLRDKALALEAYAKQAKNTEAERRACEIRLRAERKTGQLLKDMAKANERASGRAPKGTVVASRRVSPREEPTLKDLGISQNQSSKWQKLADVPEKKFERALADAEKPSTGAILREHAPPPKPKVKPVDPAALWVCGRLRDFERDQILDRDPADLLLTATAGMLEDIQRLAPMVARWLQRLATEVRHVDAKAAA